MESKDVISRSEEIQAGSVKHWYEVVETIWFPTGPDDYGRDWVTILTTNDLGEAQQVMTNFRTDAPLRDVRLNQVDEDKDGRRACTRLR